MINPTIDWRQGYQFTPLGIAVILVGLTLACRVVSPTPSPSATPRPSPTSTTPLTATPLPTERPSPTSEPSRTTTPTVTRTPRPDYAATSEAKSTQFAATAMVDIIKDLDRYNVTTQNGYLAWVSTLPYTMTVDTHGASEIQMLDPKLIVKDFVFQTDVTWTSTGGLAGCGYIFRADRSLSRGSFYEFLAIRLSGLPIWWLTYWEDGNPKVDLSPPSATSAAIKQKYNSTNTYAVIALGDRMTLFVNGKRLGSYSNNKLEEGRLAFQVAQESGETTCIFKNGWVWAIK